jgi:hypothetical protein
MFHWKYRFLLMVVLLDLIKVPTNIEAKTAPPIIAANIDPRIHM